MSDYGDSDYEEMSMEGDEGGYSDDEGFAYSDQDEGVASPVAKHSKVRRKARDGVLSCWAAPDRLLMCRRHFGGRAGRSFLPATCACAVRPALPHGLVGSMHSPC